MLFRSTLVAESAAKRVLIPGGDVDGAWTGGLPFDDSSWIAGTGGVGYERSTGFESLIGIDVRTRMYNVNAGCYIRIPFSLTAAGVEGLTSLILRVRYDDGFVAYVNGVEVARDRFTGTPQWNSLANDSHADAEAVVPVEFDVSSRIGLLRAGENLLAVHAMNASPTSSDFLLSVDLVTAEDGPQADPSVSPTTLTYGGPIPLTDDAHVKARILHSGQWSALCEAVYTIER